MKNNNQNHQPNLAKNTSVKRTYKLRTPITRIHKKIMNDPFIFTV